MSFYGTPILYPVESIPSERLQHLMMCNPLAVITQQARHALVDPTAHNAAEAIGGALAAADPARDPDRRLRAGLLHLRPLGAPHRRGAVTPLKPVRACTVIAAAQLPHARVLAASLERAHPGARLTALVLDEPGGVLAPDEPFDVVRLDELDGVRPWALFGLPERELRRSVEPFLVAHMGEPVLLLAPDVLVLGPLDDLLGPGRHARAAPARADPRRRRAPDGGGGARRRAARLRHRRRRRGQRGAAGVVARARAGAPGGARGRRAGAQAARARRRPGAVRRGAGPARSRVRRRALEPARALARGPAHAAPGRLRPRAAAPPERRQHARGGPGRARRAVRALRGGAGGGGLAGAGRRGRGRRGPARAACQRRARRPGAARPPARGRGRGARVRRPQRPGGHPRAARVGQRPGWSRAPRRG